MTRMMLLKKINSMETELEIIKGELTHLQVNKRTTKKKFSDLYGIWKSAVDIGYEEIKQAEIKVSDL